MKEVKLFNEIQLLDYEMILIKFKKIINKEIRKWSSIYEYEDLYQLALLGLYKAYTVYTLPYEFYGVAYKYIKWEIGSFHKKMSKHKAISLESAIFTDKNGVKGLALEDFDYPLSQAELEALDIVIVEDTVIIKLNGERIYQGTVVNLGDGSPGANAR